MHFKFLRTEQYDSGSTVYANSSLKENNKTSDNNPSQQVRSEEENHQNAVNW